MVAAAWGRLCAGDFTLWVGHAFPRASAPALSLCQVYPPALAEPPVSAQSRRLYPALSQPFPRRSPSSRPRLWVSAAAAAQTRGSQPSGARSRIARVAGTQQHRRLPAEVTPDSVEAQGLALLLPKASPTCLQLTSALGLPPLYPSELLKFATCSPSRRGKSARSSGTHLPAARAGAGFPAALGSGRCRPQRRT